MQLSNFEKTQFFKLYGHDLPEKAERMALRIKEGYHRLGLGGNMPHEMMIHVWAQCPAVPPAQPKSTKGAKNKKQPQVA